MSDKMKLYSAKEAQEEAPTGLYLERPVIGSGKFRCIVECRVSYTGDRVIDDDPYYSDHAFEILGPLPIEKIAPALEAYGKAQS